MKNLLPFLLLIAPVAAEPTVIRLHPGNGRIAFTVDHLVSSVDGSFENFRGQLKYDPHNVAASSVNWEVNVRSVNTGNSFRDNHLAQAEYFDADKYPTMSFVSQSTRSVDAGHLEVSGKFTLKGVSKTITVPVTIDERGFDTEFSLLRSDYGFTGGRPAVGDRVNIHLHIIPVASWFPTK